MTTTDKDTVIRGEKVVLRPKRLDDAANDYAWRSDEEMARYDAAPPLRTSYDRFLAVYAAELQHPSPYHRTYAIEDGEGRHIGNVMYYNLDQKRGEAELGISIGDRRYWSHGYGSDAVRTLVRHLFATLNLKRVYLNTLDWNIRAQKSFRKAGFVPCGNSYRDGYRFVTMEMRREWLEKDGAPEKIQNDQSG